MQFKRDDIDLIDYQTRIQALIKNAPLARSSTCTDQYASGGGRAAFDRSRRREQQRGKQSKRGEQSNKNELLRILILKQVY
ncbi:hypothetical protein OLEAN_C14450 [Oleispira antarctica RB-8]|uniref:Uncharacterized protein n=1 Tax=Oleispira antarctica RB-8 TaxID=698738 RepID=R4YLH9_OLEAN|nr:hypothetical protein OLEAN_C14450 [Oleispira antarctica RB-8]